MTSKKKKISVLKTKNFFEKYPILLFLQHNNCTTKDWSDFKKKNVEFLVLKNSIPKIVRCLENDQAESIKSSPNQRFGANWNNTSGNDKVLGNSNFSALSYDKVNALFQGPSIALGCRDIEQLDKVWTFLKSQSNLVFVGGFLQNQVLNHLDIEKLLKINHSIYNVLLSQLNVQNELYGTLKKSLNLNYLNQISQSFLNTLSVIGQK